MSNRVNGHFIFSSSKSVVTLILYMVVLYATLIIMFIQHLFYEAV